MLSKCAKLECSASFQYFGQGKVFEVQSNLVHPTVSTPSALSRREPSRVEHFWLCSECCSTMTIAVNNKREVSVVPILISRSAVA